MFHMGESIKLISEICMFSEKRISINKGLDIKLKPPLRYFTHHDFPWPLIVPLLPIKTTFKSYKLIHILIQSHKDVVIDPYDGLMIIHVVLTGDNNIC